MHAKPMVYAQPRVGVIAVTFHGDDVILIRRRNEPQQGAWGYPGGSIEPGESIHDAALRELMEETGTQAEVLALVDVVEVCEFDRAGCHHHFVLIALLCRYIVGELRAGDDATDCRWVRIPDGLSGFQGDLVDHAGRIAIRARDQLAAIQGGNSR